LGAQAMVDVLAMPQPWQAQPQSEQGITYAAKIEKVEALIDWTQAAAVLARRIRAFDPFPGAHTLWQGQSLKLWSAQALDTPSTAPPGQVVQASPQGLDVATGAGVLRVLQLQKPGGKRLGVADFLRGSDTDWHAQTLGL